MIITKQSAWQHDQTRMHTKYKQQYDIFMAHHMAAPLFFLTLVHHNVVKSELIYFLMSIMTVYGYDFGHL